jgi:hypothetical protein
LPVAHLIFVQHARRPSSCNGNLQDLMGMSSSNN